MTQVDIDDEWEPNEDEIREYAEYLGINPATEPELLPLAKEGLKAPLPAGWISVKNDDDEVYYQNVATKETSWDHPCDDLYRQKVVEARKQKSAPGAAPTPPKPPASSGSSLLSQISQLQSQSRLQQSKADDDFQKVTPPAAAADDSVLGRKASLLIEDVAAPPRTRAPEPPSRLDGPEVELSAPDSGAARQPGVQPLQDGFAQQILQLTQEHADQVRQLTAQQGREVQELNRAHGEALQRLAREHEAEVARVRQGHELEVQRLRGQLAAEYDALRQKISAELLSGLRLELPAGAAPAGDVGAAEAQNAELAAKYRKLVSENQILVQQIADTEKLNLEKRKAVNELKLEAELTQQQTQALRLQLESAREDRDQVRQEVENYQGQLRELLKEKQIAVTQLNQRPIEAAPQPKPQPLISNVRQLDCFSALGTALVQTALPRALQAAFGAEKRFIGQLTGALAQTRQEIDLRIKALEARRASFTAEVNLGVNLGEKVSKQQLVQQRKALDQESHHVQRLARNFREAWDWCKTRKGFLNNKLSLVVNQFTNAGQVLSALEGFLARNKLDEEQLVHKTLDLDTSQQLEGLFAPLRAQVQALLQFDELQRIQHEHLSWLARGDPVDHAAIAAAHGAEMPEMCAAAVRQLAGAEASLVGSPAPAQPVAAPGAQQNHAWFEKLRQGLRQ